MNLLLALFLINMSGFDFSKVWLAKHKTNHWQLSNEAVSKGNGIVLKPDPNWKSYDLRIQYSKRNYEVWEDFDQSTKYITISILPDKRWQAHYEQ